MLYTSVMKRQKKDRPLWQKILIDVVGVMAIIAAPLTGWLPGPGGIPLFVAGLGLLSLNHEWAENALKSFEQKREEYRDKFLMGSPRTSRAIDSVCIALMAVGLYLAVTQDNILLRGSGLATFTLSAAVLLSNQKRIERILGHFKRK